MVAAIPVANPKILITEKNFCDIKFRIAILT
jgi:hypothetical protein